MPARDLVENVAMDSCPRLTVIIPAFNEEAYLAATLDSIRASAEQLTAGSNADVETIVVDNSSVDGTADIARASGVTVVFEPVQGISRARNTGARHAAGDVLVFIDADVSVPHDLLQTIHLAMGDPKCIGGGVDVDFRPDASRFGSILAPGGSLVAPPGWFKGLRNSVAGASSSRRAAMMRACGWVRTSTSTGS